ncbi:MAG: hypothetical protein O7H41_05660 [Planctomycetota bacterium]|nr:hypothetical protein [Planctomycetota bacterium]
MAANAPLPEARVPKALCGICLTTLPRDQMRARGEDLFCEPCFEMAERRSRRQETPAPQPKSTISLTPKEEERLLSRLGWLKGEVQRRPDHVSTLAELVEAYEKLGKEQEASVCRQQLSRFDPGHPILREKDSAEDRPPPREIGREAAPHRPVLGVGEPQDKAAPPAPVVPFWMDVSGFLGYPFVGRGRTMLLFGGLGFGLAMTLARLSMFGGILALAVVGYLTSYWFRVISVAAAGSKEPPGLPVLTDFWNSFISPLLTFTVLGIVPFGPFFILRAMGPSTLVATLQAVAVLWGILVFPMVLLVYSMFNSISDAMKPGILVSSIKKVLPDYLILFLILSILYVVHSVVGGILFWISIHVGLKSITTGVLIYSVGTSFFDLYIFTTGSFLIGHLYHQGKGRLAWFGEATDPPMPLSSSVVRAVGVVVAVVFLVGLAGALLPGGTPRGKLPLADGLHLVYDVGYKTPGGDDDRIYEVIYVIKEESGLFRITGSIPDGLVPTRLTDFIIDSRGNFVRGVPEREIPVRWELKTGDEGSSREQSIICGPTSVREGDVFLNDWRVVDGSTTWGVHTVRKVMSPHRDGSLYYHSETGFFVGMRVDGNDGTTGMMYLTSSNVPGITFP